MEKIVLFFIGLKTTRIEKLILGIVFIIPLALSFLIEKVTIHSMPESRNSFWDERHFVAKFYGKIALWLGIAIELIICASMICL